MDGVEMIMAVEEHFGITIEDAEVERISTPRQLIDLVSSKWAATSVSGCRTRRAFHVVRRVFQDKFGRDRKSICPEAELDQLIPKSSRVEVWNSLQNVFGAKSWPKLVLPASLIMGICAVGVLSFFGFSWLGLTGFTAGLAGIATLILLFTTLRSLRTAFPSRLRTVGDLARFLAGQAPSLFESGQNWSRPEVAREVKKIVIEQLDCSNYHEDADFVKDLGMG